MTRVRKLWSLLFVAALAVTAASCGGPPPDDRGLVRLWTDDFEIRLKPDIVPPRALERISYVISVHDKETREPIVNGEGRIFATNSEVALDDLPDQLNQTGAGQPDDSVRIGMKLSLEQIENEHIRRVLAQTTTMEEAAQLLGISRGTLYERKKKLGL